MSAEREFTSKIHIYDSCSIPEFIADPAELTYENNLELVNENIDFCGDDIECNESGTNWTIVWTWNAACVLIMVVNFNFYGHRCGLVVSTPHRMFCQLLFSYLPPYSLGYAFCCQMESRWSKLLLQPQHQYR